MSDEMNTAPAEAVENSAPESEESLENTENLEESDASEESEDGSTEEVIEALEDKAKNGSAKEKKEAKKLLKSLKLKIDGKEYEENLPFEIPDTDEAREYMTRQLQMSKMAQKRAQEYSELEKEVRNYVEFLRKDPISALSDPSIGIDVKELAAKVIEKEIEDSKKTPEQIKAEKLEAELKKIQEERENEKKESEEREKSRLQEVEFERLDMEMTQILEKNDIPKNPYFIKRMADYMLMGLQQGMDVRPADVLPQVREEFENDVKALMTSLNDEQLEKMIGKDVFNRIRKKNISKIKASNPKPNPKQAEAKVESEPAKKMTLRQRFGI